MQLYYVNVDLHRCNTLCALHTRFIITYYFKVNGQCFVQACMYQRIKLPEPDFDLVKKYER